MLDSEGPGFESFVARLRTAQELFADLVFLSGQWGRDSGLTHTVRGIRRVSHCRGQERAHELSQRCIRGHKWTALQTSVCDKGAVSLSSREWSLNLISDAPMAGPWEILPVT